MIEFFNNIFVLFDLKNKISLFLQKVLHDQSIKIQF